MSEPRRIIKVELDPETNTPRLIFGIDDTQHGNGTVPNAENNTDKQPPVQKQQNSQEQDKQQA